MRHHWSCRSPAASSLWSTDTVGPKRARAARTSIGVRPISGTSTIAPRPRDSASSTARKYTSVLPLPVTPCRRNGRNDAARDRRAQGLERRLLVRGGRDGRAPRGPGARPAPARPARRRGERAPSAEAVDRPAQRGPVARRGRRPGRAPRPRAAAPATSAWARPFGSKGGAPPGRATRTSRNPGAPISCSTATMPGPAQPRHARLRVAGRAASRARRAAAGPPRAGAGRDRRPRPRPASRRRDDGAARPHARGRQDHPVALAGRREVVIGHPRREVEERRRDERGSRRGPARLP